MLILLCACLALIAILLFLLYRGWVYCRLLTAERDAAFSNYDAVYQDWLDARARVVRCKRKIFLVRRLYHDAFIHMSKLPKTE